MVSFELRTKILSGKDSLNYIKTIDAAKVFVVTDEVMVKIGVCKKVLDILNGCNIDYRVFDRVEANPSLETVQSCLKAIIEYEPCAVICVGGGSVIDAAKAAFFFLIKAGESSMGMSLKKPLFIAIPTTSGTGSEVTSFSVVTDHKNQTKIALADNIMLPDVALLDAYFTLSVPPVVTADTGMDVVTHAVEAFVSVNSSVFTDAYAEKALLLSFNNLLKAYTKPNCVEARQNMHDASCMAGIAFNNAGLGINHSLAHVVGGRFKISHGRANAILLPHVICFNSGINDCCYESYGEKYDRLAKLAGFNIEEKKERIYAFALFIKKYNSLLGLPATFKEYGIDESAYMSNIKVMAETAVQDICTGANPRPVNARDLEMLLKIAYYG